MSNLQLIPLNPWKTRLTRPMRVGIMAFLILIFCVVSPLIIFYTAGYRYSWKEKKIKQTGVISIDAEPRDAMVTLNTVRINKKLPIRLTNRAPGTYHVSIEKEGYRTWEKDIVVTSNQTTYIKDLTLFKNATPNNQPINEGKLQTIIGTFDDHRMMLISKKEKSYTIFSYNTEDNTALPIVEYTGAAIPEISASPYSRTALVITKNLDAKNVYVFSIDDPGHPAKFSFPKDAPLRYYWANTFYTNAVYVQSGTTIYRLTADGTQTVVAHTAHTIWGIDREENLWTIDKNILYLSQSRSAPVRIASFNEDKKITDIIDITSNRIIARTDDGIAVVKLAADTHEKQDVQYLPTPMLYRHLKNSEWWAWSEWELWNIAENGNVTLLNRSGDKMKRVRPMDEFGGVLVVTEKELVGFNPGYYVSIHLGDASEVTEAAVDTKARKIFFVGKYDNQDGLFELAY